MSCFATLLRSCAPYNDAVQNIRAQKGAVGLIGLPGAAKAHVVHSLCEDLSRKALVVLPDEASARKFTADINEFFGNTDKALFYPARDFSFDSSQGQSREYEQLRLRVLCKILKNDYSVIACSAEAALQLTIPRDELSRRIRKICPGDEISTQALSRHLTAAGFKRTDSVEGAGQFAIRGGIVDFFPAESEYPIRIELWGDEVDTVSTFDVSTQRRVDALEHCEIVPATEILFDSEQDLKEKIEEHAKNLSGKGSRKAKELLLKDCEYLGSGIKLQSVDKYLSLAYSTPEAIFDYCGEALLFISETSSVKEKVQSSSKLFQQELKAQFENGVLSKGLDRFSLTFPELLNIYEKRNAIYTDNLARGSFDTPVKALFTFSVQQNPMWNGSLETLTDDLRPALSKNKTCIIFAGTQKAAYALAEALENEDIKALFCPVLPKEFLTKTVNVLPGSLSSGYFFPSEGFDIFSYSKGQRTLSKQKRKKNYKAANAIQSLEELSKGDYVVHSVHGIGVFNGIKKIEASGHVKDYIHILYAKGGALYVPVTQLDLVTKYIGPREETKTLKLSHLGGHDWEKLKQRVKTSAKNMAKELIKLYSQRLSLQGHAFSPDIDMQNDFERRFEYEETDDQLRTINEIKRDMEKSVPMDRLLCGDVGFGKTEVALRAAFKCIADGKQCAILVPTTILALQHYNTIIRRFEGFPIEAQMLSRFRTAKEQTKIIKDLKRGSIDIIVGTHRLISKDIKFKDLGLIIVDEEQRFGVGQKEKLKELYPKVDCLTLSATPIPRTMNMAMSGIRDMSVIEEAPQDRFPVQTYVLQHDWSVIAEAISKELRRGGQVYYLHNKVETIEKTAATLKEWLPDANIGIGHGKMSEDELSEVWRSLLDGEIDILVCTTIIETGVDVPNANTLIIENADRLGLAQLHQIRGRVGRSARRGFAYLTFPPKSALSEIATKRLTAIREYTEFGSGFKIAMRDLEIRGAGNLLGAEQHGHMESVGYDMYMKLLQEAVLEEKGELPATTPKECLIDITIDAYIPEAYIESLPQRLSMYRRIADIKSREDSMDVIDEFIDRFGEPPESVSGLVRISLLRNSASAAGVYEIKQNSNSLLLYVEKIDMEKVAVLVKGMRGRILVSTGPKPYITLKKAPRQTALDTLEEAFGLLAQNNNTEEIKNDV
ncbi:MAG: transcription-repair coupling factor [Ruminococcaceae bacterium]|nr:transcription-repair coupling factor [Oscillospiraceae bacterium]